jgi:hypothetical protein
VGTREETEETEVTEEFTTESAELAELFVFLLPEAYLNAIACDPESGREGSGGIHHRVSGVSEAFVVSVYSAGSVVNNLHPLR